MRTEGEIVALSVSADAYAPSLVMSPDQALAHFKELKRVQREVLVKGADYAKIPGADKPSLLKSGGEKLLQFHGLAHRFVRVRETEDWHGDPPFFRYDYGCQIFKVRIMPDGTTFEQPIAYREGTCNSLEDRYRWRWVWPEQVPASFDKETLEKKVWESKGQTRTKYRVPNTDTATLANTIMQMAQKRAMVQATLAATAASGIFTDDNTEDLAEAGHLEPRDERRGGRTQASRRRATRPAEAASGGATAAQGVIVEESPRIEALRLLNVQIRRLHLNVDQVAQISSGLFNGKAASKDLSDNQIAQLTGILADVPADTRDVARYVFTGDGEPA